MSVENKKSVSLVTVLTIVIPVAMALIGNWIRVEVAIANVNAEIDKVEHDAMDNKEDIEENGDKLQKLNTDIQEGFNKMNESLNEIKLSLKDKQDRP